MPSMPSAVPSLPTVVGGENGHVGHSNIVYDEVEQLSRITVGPTHINLGGLPSPLVADSATDNSPLLSGAMTTYGPGVYILPHVGNYLFNSQVIVENKCTLKSLGRSTGVIKAGPSFPTSTPVVRMGDGSSAVFACRLEDVDIDCNNLTGSVGVYSTSTQEQSGVFGCVVANFLDKGLHFTSTAAQNFGVADCELYTSTSATAATVGYQCDTGADPRWVRDITVRVNGSGAFGAGLRIRSGQYVYQDIHVEHCTDGILIGDSAAVAGVLVVGIKGHSTVTNLVRISNFSTTNAVTALNLMKNSGTNILVDEIMGADGAAGTTTITEGELPFYLLGRGSGITKTRLTNAGGVTNKIISPQWIENITTFQRTGSTDEAFSTKRVADSAKRFTVNALGDHSWGDGTAAHDCVLKRLAADRLGTDTGDKLVANGGLGVGNSVAATTPGSVVKKMEVFDAAGASLGFVPIYSTIT